MVKLSKDRELQQSSEGGPYASPPKNLKQPSARENNGLRAHVGTRCKKETKRLRDSKRLLHPYLLVAVEQGAITEALDVVDMGGGR